MSESTVPAEMISAPQEPASPAPAPAQPRNWPRWTIPVATLAVGLLIGAAAGVGIGIASSDPTESHEYQALQRSHEDAKGAVARLSDTAREAGLTAQRARDEAAQRQAELDGREAELAAREQAVTAVEQQIAANSIDDGIWTVGVDVEPGTYRVTEALAGYCYWAIYRTGTNGSDIIDNDGPTGGYPTVTLSAGQDFENSGCGTFVKQ